MAIIYYPTDAHLTRRTAGPNLTEEIISSPPNAIFVFSGSNVITSSASASYADTASLAMSVSASGVVGPVVQSISSSYAVSASYSPVETVYSSSVSTQLGTKQNNLSTGSSVPITSSQATTASFSTSASYWDSSSIATILNNKQNNISTGSTLPITSSQSITASYAINAGSGGTTLVTGSTYSITSSWSEQSTSASYWNSSSIETILGTKQNKISTGSLIPITASWSSTAVYAPVSLESGSTYPITASWSSNSVSSSYSITSSYSSIVIQQQLYTTQSMWSTQSLSAVSSSWASSSLSASYWDSSSVETLLNSKQWNIATGSSLPITASTTISASFSITASFWNSSSVAAILNNKQWNIATGSALPITSSWAENWNSSSVVTLIGTKQNIISTGSVLPVTSSWSSNAVSASYAPQTQQTTVASASWVSASVRITSADTASYYGGSVTSASYAPVESTYSGSVSVQLGTKQNTLIAGGTYSITSSFAVSASYAPANGGTTLQTGSTYPITASWSENAINASMLTETFGTVLTSSYSISDSETYILLNASASGFPISLPDATLNAGRSIQLKKIDFSNNQITINPSGSQTIDGMNGYAFNRPNQSITVTSDGTNWLRTSISNSDIMFAENLELGLQKWRSAIAAPLSASIVNVVCFGDSITEGYNANTPNYSNGFVGKLRTNLQSLYGGSGYGLVSAAVNNPKSLPWSISVTGSWSAGSPAAGAGAGPNLTGKWATGNATASIVGPITGPFEILFHRNEFSNTAGTQIKVWLDGTQIDSFATIAAIPTIYEKKSYNNTGSNSIITITAPATQYVFFDGVVFYNSDRSGVYIHNLGVNGTGIATCTGTSDKVENVKWVSVLAPKLTIIQYDTNDFEGQTDIATWESNWQIVITEAKKTGDVLIIASNTRNAVGAIPQSTYQNVLRKLAYLNNCAFVSIKNRWGNNTNQNSIGMCTDGVHPTQAGHQDITNVLMSILTENNHIPQGQLSASYATNALSASWSSNAISASYATNVVSASHALSASYAPGSGVNDGGSYNISASWASASLSASYATNGGNSGTTLYTGSTYEITSSWSNSSKTSSYVSQPYVKIESGSLWLKDNLEKWWYINLYNDGEDNVTFLIQSGSA